MWKRAKHLRWSWGEGTLCLKILGYIKQENVHCLFYMHISALEDPALPGHTKPHNWNTHQPKYFFAVLWIHSLLCYNYLYSYLRISFFLPFTVFPAAWRLLYLKTLLTSQVYLEKNLLQSFFFFWEGLCYHSRGWMHLYREWENGCEKWMWGKSTTPGFQPFPLGVFLPGAGSISSCISRTVHQDP